MSNDVTLRSGAFQLCRLNANVARYYCGREDKGNRSSIKRGEYRRANRAFLRSPANPSPSLLAIIFMEILIRLISPGTRRQSPVTDVEI